MLYTNKCEISWK